MKAALLGWTLTFGVGPHAAKLVYDAKAMVCRQEGSVEDAFRILVDAFKRVADERDRLKWGDAQVDRWKAEARAGDGYVWP